MYGRGLKSSFFEMPQLCWLNTEPSGRRTGLFSCALCPVSEMQTGRAHTVGGRQGLVEAAVLVNWLCFFVTFTARPVPLPAAPWLPQGLWSPSLPCGL